MNKHYCKYLGVVRLLHEEVPEGPNRQQALHERVDPRGIAEVVHANPACDNTLNKLYRLRQECSERERERGCAVIGN